MTKILRFLSLIAVFTMAGTASSSEKMPIVDQGMASVLAEDRAKLPGPGVPFFDTADFGNIPFKSFVGAAMDMVDVSKQPFTKALRIEVLTKPQAFHSVQIACSNNTTSIKKGDVIFLAFSARCLKSTDDTHEGFVGASIVVNSPTWSSLVPCPT